ncbi:uncharacterized protein [Diadema antillarum]|uniref:uncharacterized protein n=1 Tax=Diadema antillarum TaxID=105358 RepID=UPI003A89E8E3
MERGIFQGCPISPYLFLLVIETMAQAVRQNDDIKGIPVDRKELKISLLADDSTCFVDGSINSFNTLFNLLDTFAVCSGCKLNISKSEAVWIGSTKGSLDFPFSEKGLKWTQNQFKTLGITFSLNVNQLFNLNFLPKLESIKSVLNCWRARNLSLIGKICVVKTLLLPQLLYQFSVLCIKIPSKFFKSLNTILYKFIWNGGNDRIKRQYLCNDYSQGGLRMINPSIFALSQKLNWVKMLHDESFDSFWKRMELSVLENFSPSLVSFMKHPPLWKTNAPESILNKLPSVQLTDSLRSWYSFREKLVKIEFGSAYSEIGACQSLWFNKNIRSRSKQYFVYDNWLQKGLIYINDLLDPVHPGSKLFEELVLDYDIDKSDRRKYNFLMKNIPQEWLTRSEINQDLIFETTVGKLMQTRKVSKYVYDVMLEKVIPVNHFSFWNDLFNLNSPIWEKILMRNLTSTIDTQLRSFFVKLFYRAIALNEFLFKIKRKDSPLCFFCNKSPETFLHLFILCPHILPLWQKIIDIINHKEKKNYIFSNFEKMFGLYEDSYISYIFLSVKYFIYVCKFQNKTPTFESFQAYLNNNKEIEYRISKKKGKLGIHFQKWRFDI